MGAGDYGINKRKRSNAFEGDPNPGPAVKKPSVSSTQLDAPAADKLRKQLQQTYESYQLLCEACGSSPDAASFQALIDAARGPCAQRRLVARLLPRFCHAFPNQLDTAAATLIDLYEQPTLNSEHAPRNLEEVTRQDALLGLGVVLLAAQGGAGAGAAAVHRVLEYLIGLAGSTPDPEPSEDGEEGHEEGELRTAHTPTSSSAARATGLRVRHLLSLTFLLHPLSFLSTCSTALAGRDVGAREGAAVALTRQLSERPFGLGSPEELVAGLPVGHSMPSTQAAVQLTARLNLEDEEALRQADKLGSAAGLGPVPRLTSGTSDQQQQQREDDGAAAGASRAVAGGGSSGGSSSNSSVPSWASRVVLEQPDVQQWVQQRLEGQMPGTPPQLLEWCRQLQQQLPQQLCAPTAPPAPPAAAAGGTAPGSSAAAAARAGSLAAPATAAGGAGSPSSPPQPDMEIDMDMDISPAADHRRAGLKRAASSPAGAAAAAAEQRGALVWRQASLGGVPRGALAATPAAVAAAGGTPSTAAAAGGGGGGLANGVPPSSTSKWPASPALQGAARYRGPAAGGKLEAQLHTPAPPTPITPAAPRTGAAAGKPPEEPWPAPGGTICVAPGCLLLSHVPPSVTAPLLQSNPTVRAAEAWLMGGGRACLTFNTTLDAAKGIMRLHGTTPWGPTTTPLAAEFAAGLPPCSRLYTVPPQKHYIWVGAAAGVEGAALPLLLAEGGLQVVVQVHRAQQLGALAEVTGALEAQQAVAFLKQRLLESGGAAAVDATPLPKAPTHLAAAAGTPGEGGNGVAAAVQRPAGSLPLPPPAAAAGGRDTPALPPGFAMSATPRATPAESGERRGGAFPPQARPPLGRDISSRGAAGGDAAAAAAGDGVGGGRLGATPGSAVGLGSRQQGLIGRGGSSAPLVMDADGYNSRLDRDRDRDRDGGQPFDWVDRDRGSGGGRRSSLGGGGGCGGSSGREGPGGGRGGERRDYRDHPDYGKTSLWLGNIAMHARPVEVLDACSRFGRMVDHKLMLASRCAFVTYATSEEALDAMAGLDGLVLAGGPPGPGLRVEWAARQPRCYGGGGGGGGDRPGDRRDSMGPSHSPPGVHRAPLPKDWEARSMQHAARPSPRGRDDREPLSRQQQQQQQQRDREERGGGGSPPHSHSHSHHHPYHHQQQQQHGRGGPQGLSTPLGPAAGNGVGPGGGWPRPSPHGREQQLLGGAGKEGSASAAASPATPAAAAGGGGGGEAAGAGSATLWTGPLRKSGTEVCTVRCCPLVVAPSAAEVRAGAPEPTGWPTTLEVNARLKVGEALAMYKSAAPGLRALLRLLPGPAADAAQKLGTFIGYLVDKQRAGLVKLPAAGSVPPRALYLLVPDAEVHRELRLLRGALGQEAAQQQQLVVLVVATTADARTH